MYLYSDVHQSGLWDATDAQWTAAAKQAVRHGAIASFTETTSFKPQPPKGWGAYHGENAPGANEATILWDRDEFDQIGPGFAVPVSKTSFALGNGKPRPRIHLIGVPLKHKASGRVVVRCVVHTPSAVEGKSGLVEGARRALAYRETLSGIASVRKSLRKRFPGAAIVVAGDWNLNLRLPWTKALIRTAMPGLKSSWRSMPQRGTHGTRVIDDIRHNKRLVVKRTGLLPRPLGFDHTPVLTIFRFAK